MPSEKHPKGPTQSLWEKESFGIPLDELVVVSGPVGNGVVHLDHAGVAGLEDGHEALHHFAAEGFAVDALPEVQLLRGDLASQAAPKVAVVEEVFFEDKLAEFNLFTS